MGDNIEGVRDATYHDKATWGTCPVCKAPHGTACYSDVGIQLGVLASGRRMQDGEGAHLARLRNAPDRVGTIGLRGTID